jgi:histidinol phosphatase-like enzyme
MEYFAALALDRDGLLIKENSGYITEEEDIELLPGVFESLDLIPYYMPVFLVTKQRGLSLGALTEDRLAQLHDHLENMLDFSFDEILIEPKNKLKTDCFLKLIDIVGSTDILYIDNDPEQCQAARDCGLTAICTNQLYQTLETIWTTQL